MPYNLEVKGGAVVEDGSTRLCVGSEVHVCLHYLLYTKDLLFKPILCN